MQFNNSNCRIWKRTNHATKDWRSNSNVRNYQTWRRVQAHLVEEEMDDDKDIGDGYNNQNDDKYDDVHQAIFVESLSATTPNPSNIKDMVSPQECY